MDTKTFLDNFGHFADAPNGVQKLRELILELAVQGKLVDRDLNEDQASILLEQIDAEEKRLIKEGVTKVTKLPEIKPEEHPYELPQGWAWVRLGAITSKIGSGSTPRGGKSVYTDSGAIFLRSQNVLNDGLKLDDVACIPNEVHQKMGNTNVLSSDILLNITGASLGRCALVPDDLGEANVSQHVTIIRPIVVEMRQYLHKLILSPYVQKMVWGRQVGMAREGLSKKVLELFEIPLPPLEEQKRIVAKVDQLMVLCDQLESQQKQKAQTRVALNNAALDKLSTAKNPDEFNHHWQRIANNFHHLYDNLENLAKFRSAILRLAVEGKLGTQNSNDTPVEDVLNQVASKRIELEHAREIAKKQYKNIGAAELFFKAPSNWLWVRLGELGDFRGGGTPSKNKSVYWDGDIWWVSPKDMKADYISSSEMKITRKAVEETTVKIIPTGSILVVARSGILKRILPVAINKVECTVNQDIKVIVPIDTAFTEYLKLMLKGYEGYILTELVKGGMTVQSLKYDEFEKQPFPIPPVEEQKRIVAKVDQLMALCDQLETKLKQTHTTSGNLVEATVKSLVAA